MSQDNERDAIARDAMPPGRVLFRWAPQLGTDYKDEEDRLIQDMPEEYLVMERPEAQSGIVIYARRRHTIECNPWTLRPLVKHLLQLAKERTTPAFIVDTGAIGDLQALLKGEAGIAGKVWRENGKIVKFEPTAVALGAAVDAGSVSFSATLEQRDPPTVEKLARDLHEAGREAVMKGATVGHSTLGEVARGFREWDDITEEAREGRRIQARWLLGRYDMAIRHECPPDGEKRCRPCDGCGEV